MGGKRIVILGTGGTLAGVADDPADGIGYRAGALPLQGVLAAVPPLADMAASGQIEAHGVAQVDSKDMGWPVWQALAGAVDAALARPEVTGIVVTHGTDTLEETAWLLHALLAATRPVVLTCAMRPATALSADGPRNLVDAVAVAQDAGARGVLTVCAGVIHGAQDVTKSHTWALDAFSSGDAGPMGHVVHGAVRWQRPAPPGAGASGDGRLAQRLSAVGVLPRVDILLNHAGADGANVRDLLRGGARGLVVAGTGHGTLAAPLEAALREAVAAGVPVVRATRCAAGGVARWADDPFIGAGTLNAAKARVTLQLALAGLMPMPTATIGG